jgi:cysteinyl-tRNA synthetase
VLGINPLSSEWSTTQSGASDVALAKLIEKLLEDRQTAREGRDFVSADRVRDELKAAGITIEDGPTGSHWSLDG